jgi:GNAT superfamily N-acetyltransferase
MSTRIRPARPDDAPFLATVMLLAARSHLKRGPWDIAFEDRVEDCLAFLGRLALTKTRSWFHHSGFIVAEVDGRAAAALCGFDPREAGTPALMQAVQEVAIEIGWTEADLGAVEKRVEPTLTCMPEETEGAWIIENVATLPEFRRRGLIHVLLEEILEKGRHGGYQLAQTAFMIGNTPVQRAYEKVGFKIVDEKRHPDFEAALGSPGIARLLRDL